MTRWMKVSVRSALLVLTLVSVLGGWLSNDLAKQRSEEAALRALSERDGLASAGASPSTAPIWSATLPLT